MIHQELPQLLKMTSEEAFPFPAVLRLTPKGMWKRKRSLLGPLPEARSSIQIQLVPQQNQDRFSSQSGQHGEGKGPTGGSSIRGVNRVARTGHRSHAVGRTRHKRGWEVFGKANAKK